MERMHGETVTQYLLRLRRRKKYDLFEKVEQVTEETSEEEVLNLLYQIRSTSSWNMLSLLWNKMDIRLRSSYHVIDEFLSMNFDVPLQYVKQAMEECHDDVELLVELVANTPNKDKEMVLIALHYTNEYEGLLSWSSIPKELQEDEDVIIAYMQQTKNANIFKKLPDHHRINPSIFSLALELDSRNAKHIPYKKAIN